MSSHPSRAGAAPPNPPPPPPPAAKPAISRSPNPEPPVVTPTGPPGSFMVDLLIFNGAPFKDHWAYWVGSRSNPDVGVLLHAVGDVRDGFRLEIKRNYDFDTTSTEPTKKIPLQWVSGEYLDEKAMFNNGIYKTDYAPVCRFEASAHKIKAPEKTLNAVHDSVSPGASKGKKITQRNCQTWIVESADQLVRDDIFSREVAAYLHAIEQ